MKRNTYFGRNFRALAVVTLLALFPSRSEAHCDGLDGPVVKAARESLNDGKLEHVLIWVRESDEPEIRAAFNHVRTVRKLGKEARELADRYFFETIVRVHRAGENAPYTGLKPAGQKLPEAILLADKAVESGNVSPVLAQLNSQTTSRVNGLFKTLQEHRKFPEKDVTAGREFVKAYVEYIHAVEALHNSSVAGDHHAHQPSATTGEPDRAREQVANEHAHE